MTTGRTCRTKDHVFVATVVIAVFHIHGFDVVRGDHDVIRLDYGVIRLDYDVLKLDLDSLACDHSVQWAVMSVITGDGQKLEIILGGKVNPIHSTVQRKKKTPQRRQRYCFLTNPEDASTQPSWNRGRKNNQQH